MLLTPLLSQEQLEHPSWLSWTKLVELFTLMRQHKIHVDDVKRIDDLQVIHSALFDAVPQYVGLKRPKHHFLTHVPQDVWRFGPPRGYWCFGYEGFNRVIKAGAKRSNFTNESLSIMTYWSMRSGHDLMRRNVTQVV